MEPHISRFWKLQFIVLAAVVYISRCKRIDATSRISINPAFVSSQTTNRRRCSERKKLSNVDSSSSDSNEKEFSKQSSKYRSWSTASPDASCKFYEGSDERRERLHQELQRIGVDPEEFLESPDYQGCSAALRTYASFILPKSKGALAMTEQPRRSKVVANNIAFLLKEHRSHQEEWLRNHDRALEETSSKRNPIVLILDNIRSAHNVGNILRASEAAKCSSVLLCGSMTPAPPHPKVLKTAMGAAEYQPYKIVGSTLQAIQTLKDQDVKVIGVETTSRSIPLWKSTFFKRENKDQKVAFVFGNEMIGVDTQCLEECDELIALPTHGIKNSLNVGNCVSIVIWEALRQLDRFEEH